jgi:hypothetical protein
MEYLIGIILALAVAGFANLIGFDRERSFYSTVLIVIASYYVLFAAIGAPTPTLAIEATIAGVFVLMAVLAFRKSLWFAAAAVAAHGVFDFVHHFLIDNPGVPGWWPGFCAAFDVMFGGYLAARVLRSGSTFNNAYPGAVHEQPLDSVRAQSDGRDASSS